LKTKRKHFVVCVVARINKNQLPLNSKKILCPNVSELLKAFAQQRRQIREHLRVHQAGA
jgi:hypothetical protein